MERFCDIGNMICQWEEMEGEVLKSGMEERGMRECRRVSKRISELMGTFEEGGGNTKTEKLVELEAGKNLLDRKSTAEKDIILSLSSKDIISTVVELPNSIETQNICKENESLSDGADWLNIITSTKLTANRKPGDKKRKRDGSVERESLLGTKKRRGE